MGDTFWGQGPLVRSVVQSDGVPQLLKEGADKIGWSDPPPRTTGALSTTLYRRGRGMARVFHTSSAGAPQPGDVIDYSGAMVKVNQDGSVDVITALMDHGGGTLEAFAKLVSEALCVPLDKVNLSPAGTRTTVYDVVTHATRGVYAGGGAVIKATEKVRAELLETAARFLNVQPEALTIRVDEALGQGVVYAPAIPDRRMTIGEIATRCWTESWKTIASVESYRPVSCPPAYVSVFVDVEVDTWTGNVRTVRAVMGSDCGTVINPDMAAGQLEGGLSKGAGLALLENNEWDAQGQLLSKGYRMPRCPVAWKAPVWAASRRILPRPTSQAGRSAQKALAKRLPIPSRRRMRMPSAMLRASAFTSCRSRLKRFWRRSENDEGPGSVTNDE
jgi:xanthine dehydrogenase molybdenum-binding subunit